MTRTRRYVTKQAKALTRRRLNAQERHARQQKQAQRAKCLFKINFILITKSLDDPFNILNQG
jgi:hypothetical protein